MSEKLRISNEDILTLNSMNRNVKFFESIKYKMKERHFKLMFDTLDENNIRGIFKSNIDFFCYRKNLINILHQSSNWFIFTEELIIFLSNPGYAERSRLNILDPYVFSLISPEVLSKLPEIFRIKYCKNLKDFLEFYSIKTNKFSQWEILSCLAEGSTLEIFRYVNENYKHDNNYIFLRHFLIGTILNEENGMEIAKYIFDIFYSNDNFFYFPLEFKRYIAKNIKNKDFLEFMLTKETEFEAIMDFKLFIKNKNYNLCKVYLDKYDFLNKYVDKFHKDNNELKDLKNHA